MLISDKEYKGLQISLMEAELDFRSTSNEILMENQEILEEGFVEMLVKGIKFIMNMIKKIIAFFRKIWAKIYGFFHSKTKFVLKHEDSIREGSLHVKPNDKMLTIYPYFYNHLEICKNVGIKTTEMMETMYDNLNMGSLDKAPSVPFNLRDDQETKLQTDIVTQTKIAKDSIKDLLGSKIEIPILDIDQDSDSRNPLEKNTSNINVSIEFFKDVENINKINKFIKDIDKNMMKFYDKIGKFKTGPMSAYMFTPKKKSDFSHIAWSILQINKMMMMTTTKTTNILVSKHWDAITTAYSARYDDKSVRSAGDTIFNMSSDKLKEITDSIDPNKMKMKHNPFLGVI